MSMRNMVLGCCIFFRLNAYGQPFHMIQRDGYMRNGVYSNSFNDAMSFMSNPACLGEIKKYAFGLLTERKWTLAELNNVELAGSGKIGKGGIGFVIGQSGDEDYAEQSLGLAYGKRLGKIDVGVQFDYLINRIAGYGSAAFISSGIGIRYKINEKLIAGWFMGIPFSGVRGTSEKENGARIFRVGLGYTWRADLFMSVEIEQFTGQPVNINGLIVYRYGDQFFFSFGIQGYSGGPFFKSGWKKNRLSVELYAGYTTPLGFSPGLLLQWEVKSERP